MRPKGPKKRLRNKNAQAFQLDLSMPPALRSLPASMASQALTHLLMSMAIFLLALNM